MQFSRAWPLALLILSVACLATACAVSIKDGAATFAAAATTTSVTEVANLVTDETDQRIEAEKSIRADLTAEDAKIRGEVASAVEDLRNGVDPGPRLAALVKEAEDRAASQSAKREGEFKRQVDAQEATITALKQEQSSQQTLLWSLFGVGTLGGAVGGGTLGARSGRKSAERTARKAA